MNKTLNVCFVCHGNICRSPLAQGVMESLVKQEGLEKTIIVSSSGVSAWHVGEPPDDRMQDTAQKHGVLLDSRARHFQATDYQKLDLILAMDHSNLSTLKALRPTSENQDKLFLFRSFDPKNNGNMEVPDPYYGGEDGFDTVLDLIEDGAEGLLSRVREQL